MNYISTRGHAPQSQFEDVVLAGLAGDGGLFVPASIPRFSAAEIRAMASLDYIALASTIMLPFMGDTWNERRLKPLLAKAYAGFRHREITPLVPLGDGQFLLELFHGPTLAFKDVALQFLGHLLGDILARRGERVTILGATSGDTGSAAISGCSGIEGVTMVILYPHQKVSEVQRRQMTTPDAANVQAVALKGNFDDCQHIVKTLFADRVFNERQHLVAVNSINWARIMAQIVYYFYAALKLGAPDTPVHFSVPTGNFGDIYAGWLAGQMGLPVGKLIIASNANDILVRCWNTGEYRMQPVVETLSPSMDIQISSNFERLLFAYSGNDGAMVQSLLATLKAKASMELPTSMQQRFREEFYAATADDVTTTAVMQRIHSAHDMLIDPHTATAVHAAEVAQQSGICKGPIVTLATAHPAKFPHATQAATSLYPPLPEHMHDLLTLPERFTVLPATADAVRDYITQQRPF